MERSVVESVLRQNHAQAASTLGLNEYQYGQRSTKYYLIEHSDLRSNYAELIGRIAYSHWWPVERLAEEFQQQIGALPGAPASWTVDALKLACILRVADACHIDARRAPGFLRALRKPIGVADKHWRPPLPPRQVGPQRHISLGVQVDGLTSDERAL